MATVKPLESLVVETSTLCQLSCTHCPAVHMKRARGLMGTELFVRILDGAPGIKRLGLSGWGEPLLNPHLADMIGVAKARGIPTVLFSTNGLLLRENANILLASGLDVLRVSVDGFPKMQKRIRGLPLFFVEDAVEDFIAERRAAGRSMPRVEVMFTISRRNEGEARLFADEWRGRVDEVLLQSVILPGRWLFRARRQYPCREFFGNHGGRLVVLWDGRVVPCCMDVEGDLCVGDANKETLPEIWQGEPMTRLRADANAGHLPDLCRRCVEYEPETTLAPKRFEDAAP